MASHLVPDMKQPVLTFLQELMKAVERDEVAVCDIALRRIDENTPSGVVPKTLKWRPTIQFLVTNGETGKMLAALSESAK